MKKEVKELLLATVTEELERIESEDVISPETIAINYVNEQGDLKLNIVTQNIIVETTYHLNYVISLERTAFWDTFCELLEVGKFDKTNSERHAEFISLLINYGFPEDKETSDIRCSNLALGVESSLLGTDDCKGGTLIYDASRTIGLKHPVNREIIKNIAEQEEGISDQLIFFDKLLEKLKDLSQIYLQWKEANTSNKKDLETLFNELKSIS